MSSRNDYKTIKRKNKRTGRMGQYSYTTNQVKKAYVKLAKGSEIKILDKIRRNKLRIEEKSDNLETLPNIGIENNPIMNRDTLRHVMDCINRMPKKQKEIMLLFVTEALDYKEIAKRTGLTELNVRVTVSRSRNQIKKEQ